MVIRTYENYENKKGALIHRGYKYYLVELYSFGVFQGTKKHKTFYQAQRKALNFINSAEPSGISR